MQLIPAIDLHAGRCVRLRQGDFSAVTDYSADAQALARRYRSWGARWLHVVDLDGAKAGVPLQLETTAALSRLSGLAVQSGGGIRTADDLNSVFASGVARAVIGSRALDARDDVVEWIARHGAARIVLALDVRLHDDRPQIYTAGWTARSGETLWDVLAWYLERTPLVHVLCTDIGRDGMMTGPNVALYTSARTRFPHIRWQASGGIRNATDVAALAELGMAAAISGTALLEGQLDQAEIRRFWPNV